MTENNREKYMFATFERDRIIKTMAIGFCIGTIACASLLIMAKIEIGFRCVWFSLFGGLTLSCMPYMWLKLPKIYNIFSPVSWLLFIIKFAIAAYAGLVVTPISLIVKIVQVRKYRRQVETDQTPYAEPFYKPANN